MIASGCRWLAGGLLLSLMAAPAAAQGRTSANDSPPPNIVLMFPDNLGIGEVGIYGGNRGVPTPRLDGSRARGHAPHQLQHGVFLHARRAPRSSPAVTACVPGPTAAIPDGAA